MGTSKFAHDWTIGCEYKEDHNPTQEFLPMEIGWYRKDIRLPDNWEDIAIGPGPIEGKQYLYIADIGDNSVRYNNKYIYRISEPLLPADQTPVDTAIYDVERMVFQYPDSNRNAETIMIDPLTLDIYIVSKESATKLYRAAYPYTFYAAPTLIVDTLEVLNSFNFSTAVGGDISSDGKEILIKRYNVLYYWYRSEDETIEEALVKYLKKCHILLSLKEKPFVGLLIYPVIIR